MRPLDEADDLRRAERRVEAARQRVRIALADELHRAQIELSAAQDELDVLVSLRRRS